MAIQFNKNVKCNSEFVFVEILNNLDELEIGGIVLPTSFRDNDRLAHAKILDVGVKAADEYGIKVGDYVMIDRLATFGHTQPKATLRYNSVICLTNENRSDFSPLKNMIFVIDNEEPDVKNIGGVFVTSSYDSKLHIGKILKTNISPENEFEQNELKVGNEVLLTKGADLVQFENYKMRIYKKDMIICTIKD